MKPIQSIQSLRGVAVLMVVAVHMHAPLQRLGYTGWFPEVLAAGVDIFFVVSGIVMWVSTSGSEVTTGDFWRRRVIRIVPMYWLVTLIVATVMLIAPWAVNNGRFDGAHLIASLLFVPWEHPTLPGQFYPVLIPGWTINAEMFFYAVFGMALLVELRARIAAVAGLFVLLVVSGVVFRPNNAVSFYTQPLILEFVIGLALGRAYQLGLRLDRRLAFWISATGIAGLALSEFFASHLVPVDRLVTWGLPATLLVGGWLLSERTAGDRDHLVLGFVGNASYSIYLVQAILISALSLASVHLPLPALVGQVSYVPVAFATVLIVGSVVHLVIERPMTRALSAASVRRTKDQRTHGPNAGRSRAA